MIFQADSQGFFEAEIPCQKGQLSIESSGYRTLIIPSQLTKLTANASFEMIFYLLPNDKQDLNKPYQQSEQKHYTLKDTSLNQKFHKTFLFRLIDAISQEAVTNAAVCFSYTQTKKTECIDTDKQSNRISAVFNQKDIVAFQAKAMGFQTYNGNLIIDHLDNQINEYPLYLLREVTLLSVVVDTKQPLKTCWLINTDGQKKAMESLGGNRYIGQPIPGQSYTIMAETTFGKTGKQVIRAQSGINVAALSLEPPIENPPQPLVTPPTLPLSVSVEEVQTVYFDQSDFRLLPAGRELLYSVGQTLKQHPNKILYIEGHTDNVGSPTLNLALSEYRAKAVSAFLFNLGVNEQQLIERGYGSTRPQATNDTEENRKKNRRVVLHFADKNTNTLTTK